MLKESPDHHDADLVLKIYDLRRETVMRESRTAINAKFWPRSSEEAIAVTATDHPLNLAYRQTSGYWEMVYGMARHGIITRIFWWRITAKDCCFTPGSSLIWPSSGKPRHRPRSGTPSGWPRIPRLDRC